MERKGWIFQIQKFCLNDGPGIRTTVFLKGCPLRCVWCHNPESWEKKGELFCAEGKCARCGRCESLCPTGAHRFVGGEHLFDREKCMGCRKCLAADCLALEGVGKQMTVEEVLREVKKDEAFYRQSGGGLTLSGGEPFLQPEFSGALLQRAKECGLHTCVETCGYAKEEHLLELMPFVDRFLFDYKMTDPVLHEKYCGVRNERILKNLRTLSALGADIVLRCPVIPGYNDTEEHFRGIAEISRTTPGVRKVEILPYHDLGRRKWEELGREEGEEIRTPSPAEILEWIARIQSGTNVQVVRG